VSITPGGRVGDSSPLGTRGLFGIPGEELDPFVHQVAHALMREHGKTKHQAIRMALGVIENWASGRGNVRPQVRAAAQRAWARFKASAAKARAIPNK
jgi:hypothetical protein